MKQEKAMDGAFDTLKKTDRTVYELINKKVVNDGCRLKAPFMTLSFMALLVIPELKLSDRGLFNVQKFNFTDLFYSDLK
jgi:adenine deaminase